MPADAAMKPTTVSNSGKADFRAASVRSTAASLPWSSARDARSSMNSATPSKSADPEPSARAAMRQFTDV